MNRSTTIIAVLALGALVVAGCAQAQAAPPASPAPAQGTNSVGMANPAAVFCQQQPGCRYEIRTAADGSQQGFCIFADGSACDEWAFFGGECAQSKIADAPTPAPTPADDSSQVVDGWVGTVLRQEPGDALGPYFQREDGQRYGIGAQDAALTKQIADLRGTGSKVKVWGKLFTGVPADQARHIEVERMQVLP